MSKNKDSMKKTVKQSFDDEIDSTVDAIEASQLDSEVDTERDAELNESVDDVSSDETFGEEVEGKILPIEKSGEPETPKGKETERFSIDHTDEIPSETKIVGKSVKNPKLPSGGGTDDNEG